MGDAYEVQKEDTRSPSNRSSHNATTCSSVSVSASASTTKIDKKRKRKGPWDVKLGSIVAVRQKCPRITQIKHRKSNNRSSPNEVGGRCEEWVSPNPLPVTWTLPTAGRDDGLALIGRIIRFLPSAITSIERIPLSLRNTGFSDKADSDDDVENDIPWIQGEVVAVQYPQSKEQGENKFTVAGVLVDKGEIDKQDAILKILREDQHGNKPRAMKRSVALQVKLQAIATSSKPLFWNIMRISSESQKKKSNGTYNLVEEKTQVDAQNGGNYPDETKLQVLTLYTGDGFDSEEQQELNFQWISRDKAFLEERQKNEGNPPIWHGEVISMSDSPTKVQTVEEGDTTKKPRSMRSTVTLKKIWLPEETVDGRQNTHGVDEIFDEVAKKKSDITFRVDLDHVIVVGRELIRSKTPFESIVSLRKADNGKATSNRPPLFVTHSYSPKSLLYKPVVLPTAENMSNKDTSYPLSATGEMGQCHGCRRVYTLHESILSTCKGGLCHGNFWCMTCSSVHKLPKTSPSSKTQENGDTTESFWVGPCCLGSCDCAVCLETVRKNVTYYMRQNFARAASLISRKHRLSINAEKTPSNNSISDLGAMTPKICGACMLPCALNSVKCITCTRELHKKCLKWEQAIQPTILNGSRKDNPKKDYQCITCSYYTNNKNKTTNTDTMKTDDAKRENNDSLLPVKLDRRMTGCKTRLFESLNAAVLSYSPIDFNVRATIISSLPNPQTIPIAKARQGGYATSITRRDDTSVGSGGTGLSKLNKKKAKSSKKKGKFPKGQDNDDNNSIDGDDLETILSQLSPIDVIRGEDGSSINQILVSSRTMSYDRENKTKNKYFAQHGGLDDIPPIKEAMVTVEQNLTRDIRVSLKKATVDIERDSSVAVGRAARAKQRRMIKDMGAIASMDLLAPNTLAGRETRLRFGRSRIHRWGIFAEEGLTKGDMIVEYRGELISIPVANAREKKYEIEKIGSDYMFRIDNKTVCDATKQGNVARFFNASCEPNCITKIIDVNNVKRVAVYALKDIPAGTELVYDYKFPIEYDESKRIPCLCGSKNCRGFLNWDKRYVLLPEDQEDDA